MAGGRPRGWYSGCLHVSLRVLRASGSSVLLQLTESDSSLVQRAFFPPLYFKLTPGRSAHRLLSVHEATPPPPPPCSTQRSTGHWAHSLLFFPRIRVVYQCVYRPPGWSREGKGLYSLSGGNEAGGGGGGAGRKSETLKLHRRSTITLSLSLCLFPSHSGL